MKISPHKRGGFYTTLTINGKKNFIYGATPEEVDEKYTEMKFKYNQGYNVSDNPTLKEYLKRWFIAYKEGVGAIETQNMYRNCINVHINPALGKYKLKEITSTQVQAFLRTITSSKSLAHKIRITLNQVFKAAIADRLIAINPVVNTAIIAPNDPKRDWLTPVQRELLIHILDGHKVLPIAMTILYTGMRMGEASALQLPDFDLENEVVHVTKAFEFDHYKPKIKNPKTDRGFRHIPIPDESYLSFMGNYMKSRNKKSLYVFPGWSGGPMGLTEMRRIWKQARKKTKDFFNDEANQKYKEQEFHLTFRLLRHTYCTGLYDAGIDEVTAAEIMGHDVKVMRSIYTHVQNSRRRKTVEKLKNLYKDSDDDTQLQLKESN